MNWLAAFARLTELLQSHEEIMGSIRVEHLGKHEAVDPYVNSGNCFLLASTCVRPDVHLMSVLWWTGIREVLALLWRVARNREWRH